MSDVTVSENVMPFAQFESLRTAALSHPMISETTLNRRFQKTRGFAFSLRQDAIGKALQVFPFLESFFHLVGISADQGDLQNIHRFEPPVMKAFYVNLLLVSSGGDIGRHVDATLMKPMGIPDLTPSLVSVLLLQRPRWMWGGKLMVYRKRQKIASVNPKENQLTVFRGNLPHAVGVCRSFSSKPRASLVCESYVAPMEAVMRLQPFTVLTKANFDAHLQFAKEALR